MILHTYKSGLLQNTAYKLLRLHVSKTLEDFNLTLIEWVIVSSLYEKETLRLIDIAQILDVEPPFVTSLIDVLESKGFVLRKDDPSDRRAKLISLNTKKLSLIPEIENQMNVTLRKLLKGLTNEELGIYKKVLETIIQNSDHTNID